MTNFYAVRDKSGTIKFHIPRHVAESLVGKDVAEWVNYTDDATPVPVRAARVKTFCEYQFGHTRDAGTRNEVQDIFSLYFVAEDRIIPAPNYAVNQPNIVSP